MVNLTIGGGNFKGISYLGTLEYLHQNNLVNKIDNFYGTSVGSISRRILFNRIYTDLKYLNLF